jgi:hypothetical protein
MAASSHAVKRRLAPFLICEILQRDGPLPGESVKPWLPVRAAHAVARTSPFRVSPDFSSHYGKKPPFMA